MKRHRDLVREISDDYGGYYLYGELAYFCWIHNAPEVAGANGYAHS